jgi:predicted  nucleic acid-binding Zn-ribbon protein
MFKWIRNLTKSYQIPENYELLVTDTNGEKHSLVGLCASLAKEVLRLEERITALEGENVETTNCLYEIENRLQSQIDKIHPVVYNLKNNNWDQ